MSKFYQAAKKLLFSVEPETAHNFSFRIAKILQNTSAINLVYPNNIYPELRNSIWGLEFSSPIGLAAGFDKNSELTKVMEKLGFGFLEVGSVTQNPSEGNPKPRLFRLPADKAIINRMGLNNNGPAALIENLKQAKPEIPVAINIAKTNNPKLVGDAATKDLLDCYQLVAGVASFSVLNISCPNTKEGKTFEDPEALSELLAALSRVKPKHSRLLLKFSSDLEQQQLAKLLEITESFDLDGYLFSNTSNSRQNLKSPSKLISDIGTGGLSGSPIFNKSLANLAFAYGELPKSKILIGLGGIDSAEKAYRYIQSGASLVEIYTGLVYEGPSLVESIKKGLVDLLKKDGFSSIVEAIGSSNPKS